MEMMVARVAAPIVQPGNCVLGLIEQGIELRCAIARRLRNAIHFVC